MSRSIPTNSGGLNGPALPPRSPEVAPAGARPVRDVLGELEPAMQGSIERSITDGVVEIPELHTGTLMSANQKIKHELGKNARWLFIVGPDVVSFRLGETLQIKTQNQATQLGRLCLQRRLVPQQALLGKLNPNGVLSEQAQSKAASRDLHVLQKTLLDAKGQPLITTEQDSEGNQLFGLVDVAITDLRTTPRYKLIQRAVHAAIKEKADQDRIRIGLQQGRPGKSSSSSGRISLKKGTIGPKSVVFDDKKDDWKKHMACTPPTQYLFFPPHKEQKDKKAIRERQAKDICARCPVEKACREDAVNELMVSSKGKELGIRGGLNDKQLRALVSRQRKAAG